MTSMWWTVAIIGVGIGAAAVVLLKKTPKPLGLRHEPYTLEGAVALFAALKLDPPPQVQLRCGCVYERDGDFVWDEDGILRVSYFPSVTCYQHGLASKRA